MALSFWEICMYDVAVSIIQEYMEECLFEPGYNWPDEEFKTRCYERWTANELLDRMSTESMRLPEFISAQPLKTPYHIIEEFIEEMDYHARSTDNRDHHFMFSVVRDTAIDIILLFV